VADIKGVITGELTIPPGSSSRDLVLPPNTFGLALLLAPHPAYREVAQHVAVIGQSNHQDTWSGELSYHVEFDSTADNPVILTFRLITTDQRIVPISYGGS